VRRGVILLNLLLAAATGICGWQMYRQYHQTLARQRAFLARRAAPPAPLLLALPADPPQVQAASYVDIAARLPFSPDRNPTVVVEVAPPKPMPALPAYHGMMNFGQGPRVILSTGGAPQKSYAVGDTIGQFKLLAVAQSGLVFEWDGKQVPAGYAELMRRAAEAAPAAQQAVAPSAAPSAPPPQQTGAVVSVVGGSSTSASSGGSSRLMSDTADSQGMRDCKSGDNTPDGTVVDGYRKVTTRSPFGTICRWVPVK
jgi:hypothetical protein